ncbi:hypothetical protein [Ferrimonas balearica]|uniref:hypothetical protein n=1 Tax=Ferrimonas balearica TaxID=44012 RepID=UPI001C99F578|nr:hypothetical protein [Ferrimonas balearica]MBY5993630.1 hypothetical protein [Ferrimonas balearica]
MNQKLCLLALLSATLTACGGSSSGDGDDNGGGTPPPPPPQTTLALQTLNTSQCGVESAAAGVEVLVHRTDGSVISSARTGSDGRLDLVWPDGAAHLTVAGERVAEDGSRGPDIRTQVAWNSGDPGTFRFTNLASTAGCQCTEVTLDGNDVLAQFSGLTLHVTTRTANRISTRQLSGSDSFTLCGTEAEWAPVDLVLRSDFGEAYAAELTADFLAEPYQRLDPALFMGAENRGELVSLAVNDNYSYSYSFAETERGRRHYAYATPFEPVYYFPGLHEHNLVQAYEFLDLGAVAEGSVSYLRANRDRVRDGAVSLTLPTSQNAFFDEALRVLVGMTEGSDVSGYDFRGIGEGRNLLTVTLADRNGQARWTVDAPLSGTLPALELPDAYLQQFEGMAAPELTINSYGYHQALDTDSYRRRVRELAEQGGVRSDFYDRYVYEMLIVTLNGL